MKLIETGARLVLGGIFLLFGAEYLLHFMPALPFTEEGGRYLEALIATGYMFPLIKSVEVIGAILILSGRFVPLGLLLVAPIILNIALYHLVLDPNGGSIAAALAASATVLAWAHRAAFRPLFLPSRPTPAPARDREQVAHAIAARP